MWIVLTEMKCVPGVKHSMTTTTSVFIKNDFVPKTLSGVLFVLVIVDISQHCCCIRVGGACFWFKEIRVVVGDRKLSVKFASFPHKLHIPHTDLQNKSWDHSGD